MALQTSTESLRPADVGAVLVRIAGLLRALHGSDLALQNALSMLAVHARATPEMVDLQHVDLVTQTHADLAALLSELGFCLAGQPRDRTQLKASLTLRSLQDSLIESASHSEDVVPGEVALF
jgi:hypothetical protein